VCHHGQRDELQPVDRRVRRGSGEARQQRGERVSTGSGHNGSGCVAPQRRALALTAIKSPCAISVNLGRNITSR
jgi:hypothetical protein